MSSINSIEERLKSQKDRGLLEELRKLREEIAKIGVKNK